MTTPSLPSRLAAPVFTNQFDKDLRQFRDLGDMVVMHNARKCAHFFHDCKKSEGKNRAQEIDVNKIRVIFFDVPDCPDKYCKGIFQSIIKAVVFPECRCSLKDKAIKPNTVRYRYQSQLRVR